MSVLITKPYQPPRSPEARRFDPPLRRRAWRVEQALGREGFLADARLRWGQPDAAFTRLLWHRGLHLNGRPFDPATAPETIAAGSWVRAWGFLREPEPVVLRAGAVLHDRDGCVAVDKPAWLPMQGTRASQRLSLEARLRERLGAPELVAAHRLDRQTSGVALFARDRPAARWLGARLRERRVEKRYLAWVSPPPAEECFEVRGFLRRAPHPSRFRFELSEKPGPGARESASRFRRICVCGARALLAATPLTGRAHQLRVHLAARGTPIVGDDLYGPVWRDGAPSAASRVQLHAERLRLQDPRGETLELQVPPPEDFLGLP